MTSLCLLQGAQKQGAKSPPSLAPEVLSVFVPPFVSKEDSAAAAAAGASSGTLGKAKRRSFRRKRDRPRAEPGRGPRGAEPEDAGIPDGVDLLALPQLCFPGAHKPACPPGAGQILGPAGRSSSPWPLRNVLEDPD